MKNLDIFINTQESIQCNASLTLTDTVTEISTKIVQLISQI